MTKDKLYHLLDSINRSGIDNGTWGLCQDPHTKSYFGSKEDLHLKGSFLYLYRDNDDMFYSYTYQLPAFDHSLHLQDSGSNNLRVELYKID